MQKEGEGKISKLYPLLWGKLLNYDCLLYNWSGHVLRWNWLFSRSSFVDYCHNWPNIILHNIIHIPFYRGTFSGKSGGKKQDCYFRFKKPCILSFLLKKDYTHWFSIYKCIIWIFLPLNNSIPFSIEVSVRYVKLDG